MAIALRLSAYATIIILNLSKCRCTAEFEQFPGFDVTLPTSTVTKKFFFYTPKDDQFNASTNSSSTQTLLDLSNEFNFNITANKTVLQLPWNMTMSLCPEDEVPINIGPYEVPTQRDLVKHMKIKLLKVFNRYHAKVLNFLKDIKEATKATSEAASKCPSDRRQTYTRCVIHVNKQCNMITKSLVTSLEYQRHDVIALTERSICSMSAMKTDPVQLIKNVAMESVSLEFALLGFLRLLSACSYYCNTVSDNTKLIKPKRHLSDQEIVIKHFLSRKKNFRRLNRTP